MNDLVSTAAETATLLESLREDTQSYHLPFPMAVFGTLRRGCGNHPLMGTEDLRRYRQQYRFTTRFRAFLPHFVARGISLFFQENASCPLEVYTYDAKNWGEMIHSVDALEGFYPGNERNYGYGYNRTLAHLHILPDEFEHPLFPESGRPDLGQNRDLKIPVAEWQQYPRIPCWVYSSGRENQSLQKSIEDSYPLIWYNTKRVAYQEQPA